MRMSMSPWGAETRQARAPAETHREGPGRDGPEVGLGPFGDLGWEGE